MLSDTEAELRERITKMETQIGAVVSAMASVEAELKKLRDQLASEKLSEVERNAYQRGALRIGYSVLAAAFGILTYLASYVPGILKSALAVVPKANP